MIRPSEPIAYRNTFYTFGHCRTGMDRSGSREFAEVPS